MEIKAVILDLDGVITSTDEYHYQGWKHIADEEKIYFDRQINQRLRGISRMQSLEILLEKSRRTYTSEEKKQLAERKNNYYRELLKKNLTPDETLPGVMDILNALKKKDIKIAIASSSKNTPVILRYIGLADFFDAVVDGNSVSKSKPDPEVFLLAAQKLGIPPEQCLVVENAEAGVEAGLAGGMRVLAVGYASKDKRATLRAKNLACISADEMLSA